MRVISQILKMNSKKLSFITGALLAVVGLAGVGLTAERAGAIALDCDNNAIIKCGYSGPGDFISKVRANDSLNGHHDLQAVYGHYGLSSADYDNFISHAHPGTLYRDGRIVVGGYTVANGARSIGRIASYHGSNYFTVNINGSNYYGNTVDKTLAPGVQSLPIYALLDDWGNLKIAVIQSCGNPTFGNNVPSSASCDMLNETPIAGKMNTYSFTTNASHTGNATIKSYVYDFGDGSPTVTTTDGSAPVQHTYSKAGTFTASVTVYASAPYNSNIKLPTVTNCTKKITVQLPFYNCIQMVGAILDKTKMQYSFTVTANAGNGAMLTSADFDFGDGKSQYGVAPTTTNTVAVTHTYATAGQYNAAATLHFNVNGTDVTAPTCKALVTPQTVTPECKPGVPVGSPACTPCQYDTSLPSDSEQCKPPVTTLPNTGAGNTIAIFAVVMIGGFLVYRQFLFKKHRAAFVAAERGTSALPLGDPLNQDSPLAGTPLQSKRKSLRRRRLF